MLMHFLTRVSYHYPQQRVLPRGHRSRVWGVASDRLDRPGRGLPAAPPRSRRRLRARTGGFTPAPKRGCTPLARGFARSFWSPRLRPGLPPRLLRLRSHYKHYNEHHHAAPSCSCRHSSLRRRHRSWCFRRHASATGSCTSSPVRPTRGIITASSTPVDTGGTGMHSTPRGVYHLVVCSVTDRLACADMYHNCHHRTRSIDRPE
jgi:hypothetical protein